MTMQGAELSPACGLLLLSGFLHIHLAAGNCHHQRLAGGHLTGVGYDLAFSGAAHHGVAPAKRGQRVQRGQLGASPGNLVAWPGAPFPPADAL